MNDTQSTWSRIAFGSEEEMGAGRLPLNRTSLIDPPLAQTHTDTHFPLSDTRQNTFLTSDSSHNRCKDAFRRQTECQGRSKA